MSRLDGVQNVMQWVSTWWGWLAIAAIPGGLNTWVALDELFEKCRLLPFFKPHHSPGFWLWVCLQFAFPSVLFGLAVGLQNQPVIDSTLLGQAVAFGMGFLVVFNSRTDIAKLPTVDLKNLYNSLIQYAYKQIANQQTGKTAAFAADVESDLRQRDADFDTGFQYLTAYFARDVSLTPEAKQGYQERVQTARTKPTRDEVVEAILSLLEEVRRADMPEALRRFGVAERLIQKYFPRSLKAKGQRAPRV